MRIDNLKLRTKVLIPLALMAMGVLAVAGFGATRLMRVSSTASEIIERRDVAAVELVHASRLMAAAPHAIFAILLYDQNNPQGQTSKQEFESLGPESVALLDRAASLLPDKAAEIAEFKKRFQALATGAQEAFKVSLGTTGLLHASVGAPNSADGAAARQPRPAEPRMKPEFPCPPGPASGASSTQPATLASTG